MIAISTDLKKRTQQFIILLGCISLFADMTYEGGRSINGPYLQTLGTTGTAVGIIAGLGELVGYGLRLFAGYFSDRSHKYWQIVVVGYLFNLLSVPLLAFAGYWQVAAILIIAERAGKAIRTPTRDAMLSYAGTHTGSGWAFGFHNFFDQLGATIGPLLIAAVLFYKENAFSRAYLMLLIPAISALLLLWRAKKLYPRPQDLEIASVKPGQAETFTTPGFILFTIAAMCLATGYVDYPLIAYHFKKQDFTKDYWIAILYALAMLTEGLTSLGVGRYFDKKGLGLLISGVVISMFFSPLVFLTNNNLAIIGMILWGIGMGIQGAVLKAVVSNIVPSEKRATAFGLFDTAFGAAWFIGSAYMGYLYDHSVLTLVIFSINMQFLCILCLIGFLVWKKYHLIDN